MTSNNPFSSEARRRAELAAFSRPPSPAGASSPSVGGWASRRPSRPAAGRRPRRPRLPPRVATGGPPTPGPNVTGEVLERLHRRRRRRDQEDRGQVQLREPEHQSRDERLPVGGLLPEDARGRRERQRPERRRHARRRHRDRRGRAEHRSSRSRTSPTRSSCRSRTSPRPSGRAACTRASATGSRSTSTRSAMYWNKAVFKKAGLDPEKPPANKNDCEEALKTTEGQGDPRATGSAPFQFTGGLQFGR